MKKLKFHTAENNGKSKCNVMHVGKHSVICPKLEVHGTSMHKITHTTYLGDIVAADSKNDINIQSRVGKGLGNITRIMNMLDKVTLGSHYFKTAMLLRESLFLSALLTNSESWHGVTTTNINQLESIDKLLLRKILKTPISTPIEAMYLELGILRIGTVIKARRINFLHYLLNRKETKMISQIFRVQWNHPNKNDWTILVKQDLCDFNFEVDVSSIKRISESSFKNLVKKKAYDYEFNQLLEMKKTHSKMNDLVYSKLEIQNYLKLENLNKNEAQTLFRFRTRMAKFGENFRGNNSQILCPLCKTHLDGQRMCFDNCPVVKANIAIFGNYNDIFNTASIPSDIVQTLVRIEKLREEYENKSQNEANSTSCLSASDNRAYCQNS